MKNFNIFKNSYKKEGSSAPDYKIMLSLEKGEKMVEAGAGWVKEGAKGKYISCKLNDVFVDNTKGVARQGFDLIQEGIDRVKEMPEMVETDNVKVDDIPF